jgi:hypothetical protein
MGIARVFAAGALLRVAAWGCATVGQQRKSRALGSATALLLAASAHAQPPAAPPPGNDAKASAQPVTVLLRLTALINNEVLDSPFSLHANHNKLNFFVRTRDISGNAGYYSPLTTGDRMPIKKPANSDDVKSGWAYLKLIPGQYQVALDWLAEGLTTFKQTPEFQFTVSSDSAATYIGTISLSCVDTSTMFSAHRTCDTPAVGDESAKAAEVIRRLLTPDATATTSLATAAGFFH